MPAKNREVSPYSREEAERRLDGAAARKRQGAVRDRVARSRRRVNDALPGFCEFEAGSGQRKYVHLLLPVEFAFHAARTDRAGTPLVKKEGEVDLFAAGIGGGEPAIFKLVVRGGEVALACEYVLLPAERVDELPGTPDRRDTSGSGIYYVLHARAATADALSQVSGLESFLLPGNRVAYSFRLGRTDEFDPARAKAAVVTAFQVAGFLVALNGR